MTKPKATQTKLQDKVLESKETVDDLQTAIDPEVLYLILTAETALQREQYAIALEAYMRVAKQVDDVKILEKTAQIALFLENLDKTEEAVDLWLAKDSENITARRVALTVALNQKNQAAAIEHLNFILEKYPADFNGLLLDIQKSLKTKENIDFSEQLLNALETQHPKQAAIFLSQTILAIQQQNFDKAKQKVARALLLQPKWEKAIELEAGLWMYSGKKAFSEQKYSEALAAFKKIKYEKLKLDATIAIISVLFKQEKFDQATLYLNTLHKEHPDKKMRIFILEAELQNSQKNYQEAFTILTKALKESPAEREVLYARSLIAEKLDDLITLEADLNKILQQNPNDAAALNALGYTLVNKTTRYEEAERYLSKALSLNPEEAVIIDSYGWLKFKQGDFQAALKYLQQAREKLTGEHEIIAHIAEVLWQLNQKDKARKLIADEMKKTPEDPHLLEFKSRILDKDIK
ncbi:MAG: tetratricopeptide repeat protein [Methylococcales bacterium]|nr:tetratricopeptide repeat protein [Methylococcales bacterium]